MIRIAAALLLLSSTALAQEVDEQTKINALKIGYALNGNSMSRWGSIDLSSLGKPLIPPVLATEEVKPEKKRKRERRRYRRHRR